MKIKLLALFQGPYGRFARGAVIESGDISQTVLKQWVKDGYAEIIEEVETAAVDPKPETAVKKTVPRKRVPKKKSGA